MDRSPCPVLACLGLKNFLSGRHNETNFYVMDDDDTPLKGLLAARDLGFSDAKINCLSMSYKVTVQDSESSTRMPDIYQKYPQLFSETLEPTKNFSYDIQIDPNGTPIAQKERVPDYAVQSWTKDEIQKMFSLGVIEEFTESWWISPIHVVFNESKEPRFTIDLRLVHKSIIRHLYPMPKVQDLLAQFSDSKYFSKLDMRKGYWQIEMTNETSHITTFAVFGRVFRVTRLPSGMKGASDAMDLLMNLMLQGLDGVAKLQNDVAVHGKTREEHDERLFAVLDCMAEYGVTLNKKKCEKLKHEIKFLGHIVGNIGVSADPGEVEGITYMPRPTTVSQLRSILSSISFLQQYTPNMTSLLQSLHNLNRKTTKWTWNTEHEAAFPKAKSLLCSSPCFTLYRTEAEHKLVVDGSLSASGAVLLQKEGEKRLPVNFCSKVFSEVEQRYAQIEREALAIYNGLTKCHNDIYGKRITVVTDHKPLLRVFNKQATSIRLQCIVDRCADYDSELIFHLGPVNTADALSRPHKSASSKDSEIEIEVKFSLVQPGGANTFTTIRTATLVDEVLQILTAAIRDEWKKANL